MSNIDKQALNQEKIEWLNKLADMEDCKSNPGHWLMSLKDTNMLAKLALRSVALLDELEAKDKRIAELERDETQLIEERDSAEQALSDMYEAAMGDRPEWSNLFGYADAIDDVAQRVSFLDIEAAAGKGE